MQNIRPSSVAALLVTGALAASGCATVVKGTDQNMTFNSEPDGATVTVGGRAIGKTPVSVTIDKAQHQSLTFEKEGYKPYTTELSTTQDGWFWGNAVFLVYGFFGSTTDASSGAIYKYSPDHYFVTLTLIDNYGIPTSKARNTKQFVMAYVAEIRLELAAGGGKNTDTLLTMLGVEEEQKSTAIKALKRLSDQNPDDLDFANSIVEFYGLESEGKE
jgi:hypothetical protein